MAEYKTKKQALEKGASYAGHKTNQAREEALKRAEIQSMELIRPFGWPPHSQTRTLEVHIIENIKGDKVGLGVRESEDGYNLWLIYLESKIAVRA